MAGSDYSSVDNVQIFFPAGSFEDAEACTNISIIDDGEFEQEEVFTVEITVEDRTFDVVVSGRSIIDITITDNNGEALQLSTVGMFAAPPCSCHRFYAK